MTSITAIVPTYNRAAYLRDALTSLQAQTRPIDEIIVWDDGSTDGTEAAVRELGFDIRYFRAPNGGKSRALNAALEKAGGDYVWICDDDDLALPHAAETLAGMLDGDPSLGAAGAGYLKFRDDPATGARQQESPGYWPDLSRGTAIRHLLEDIFLFQNATMTRRAVHDRAGPFREDLARSIDYDMIVRLGLCAPIRVIDAPVFLQRKHDGDRGPAAARHAAARSEEVWKETDRRIFSELRDHISLGFYESMFDADDAALARRAALLQRACVYARRTDWPAALADMAAATEACPGVQLSTEEQQICRRAVAGKHGIDEMLQPDTRRRIIDLGRRNPVAAELAREMALGLKWRIREAMNNGRPARALSVGRMILALGAAGGTRRGAVAPARIAERQDLPDAAYP
ncbi:glycosyltransferase family 2 protein [Marinibacterium sp. SX1]|uniref:glycosyltransferase family 2 protein n=1 Tax=Marinibacterium sp. SX1 TaxID=3388424 RepID=UPI003D16E8A0